MRDSKISAYLTAIIVRGLRTRYWERLAQRAESAPSDPIKVLWHDFTRARDNAQKLTFRQQAIESMMLECLGASVAQITRSDGEHVGTSEPVLGEEVPDGTKETLYHGGAARVAVEAPQVGGCAADAVLGYSDALRAEARALYRVRDLAERLWGTPAASLIGVIAKLDVLLSVGAPSPVAQEFPWPQLRVIRSDLERLRIISTPPSHR
jgi:hypothetical protein